MNAVSTASRPKKGSEYSWNVWSVEATLDDTVNQLQARLEGARAFEIGMGIDA